jgi:hypothetical protein
MFKLSSEKKLFVVTVVSSFKHKMIVKAKDADEAQSLASDLDQDYYQRHMGDVVTDIKEVKGGEEKVIAKFHREGYF